MIEYFEQLTQEEQEDLTDVIRLLYRQTFLLERKFDKRAGRLQYQREYRICEKHIDFLKMYFQIAGITLCENVHLGLIYIQDEMIWGEKLPRLATIYILLLKLIYDEQMASVSSSSQIVTTQRKSRRFSCASKYPFTDRDEKDHCHAEKISADRAIGCTGRVK